MLVKMPVHHMDHPVGGREVGGREEEGREERERREGEKRRREERVGCGHMNSNKEMAKFNCTPGCAAIQCYLCHQINKSLVLACLHKADRYISELISELIHQHHMTGA